MGFCAVMFMFRNFPRASSNRVNAFKVLPAPSKREVKSRNKEVISLEKFNGKFQECLVYGKSTLSTTKALGVTILPASDPRDWRNIY